MSIGRFRCNISRALSSEGAACKVAQDTIGRWSWRKTRGEDDELIAAKTCNDVFLTHDLLHEARKFLQNRIALKMPIRVVDAFEVVDIDRDERARTRFGTQRGFDAIDRS